MSFILDRFHCPRMAKCTSFAPLAYIDHGLCGRRLLSPHHAGPSVFRLFDQFSIVVEGDCPLGPTRSCQQRGSDLWTYTIFPLLAEYSSTRAASDTKIVATAVSLFATSSAYSEVWQTRRVQVTQLEYFR